jgi:exodeoxyribonuclease-3
LPAGVESAEDKFPAAAIEKAGYGAIWHGQKPERWVKDALFFPESRAAYQKLLALGWTDAIRKLYSDQAMYTFWDYFRNAYARNAGIRIDHFLLNDRAAKMLVAAGVEREVRGWEKTSDHAPAWITLKPKKSAQRRTRK